MELVIKIFNIIIILGVAAVILFFATAIIAGTIEGIKKHIKKRDKDE